jgi:hypothetical protein
LALHLPFVFVSNFSLLFDSSPPCVFVSKLLFSSLIHHLPLCSFQNFSLLFSSHFLA